MASAVTFRGGSGSFEALEKRLADHASPRSAQILAQRLAYKYEALTQKCFAEGRDPYGKKWTPLRDGSGRTPLTKTGALKRGLRPRWSAKSFAVSDPSDYGRYHYATRPFLLSGKLPTSYRQAFLDVIRLHFKW